MNQEEFFSDIKALVLEAIGVGEHEQSAMRTLPAQRERLFFIASELALQYGALYDRAMEAYNSNPPTVHLN